MYDAQKLEKLPVYADLAPEAFGGFVAFDQAAFKPGAIPLKVKELIAVGVALATQCPYCIKVHAERAVAAGATQREIAETALVSAAIRAGGAVTHGLHALN